MDFKNKKINKLSAKHYSISASVIISIVVIVLLLTGIVKAVSSIDFTIFLSIAGEQLQQDSFGHTNFLLLGTGGKNHEGSDLTDTIMVASLDSENNLVTMLSVPRDLWVKDEIVGSSRINEVYYNAKNYYESSTEGLNHMKSKVEEIVGVPVHYWVKVNFQGFKDLIDALGGIDIFVPEAIHDPYYPKDGTFDYETFSITEGQHHLDGETALKYARSRKTTSDFDRAERQQAIFYAMKEQALKTETILDKDKIENILNVLKDNIETNIKVKEMLTMGSMAGDFQENQIEHRLIHDDPNICGGFLYTPDRSYYNGQFVLVPAGGYDYVYRYSDLNFNLPQVSHTHTTIHIMNGTPTWGIAAENKQILKRYCFDVIRHGNARSDQIQTTTYYYPQKYNEKGKEIDSRPVALDWLQRIIPGAESTEIPAEYQVYDPQADIILEIGADYANSPNYVEDPFYALIPLINAAAEANAAAAEENPE